MRAFVENLEDVMIDVCAAHGVEAVGRLKDETGVWVGDRKIGQIGIRVSRGCGAPRAAAASVWSRCLLSMTLTK